MRRDPWNEAMYHIRNAPVYLLWLVCGAAVVTLVVSLFIWVLGLLALVLAIGLVYWGTGQRIEIKQNEIVTGHLKWFTYTPVEKRS